MANDITFRRIHGRIVPIKRKDGASNSKMRKIAQGAGAIGAGVAAAAAFGSASSNFVRKAGRAEHAAREALKEARVARDRIRAVGPLFARAAMKEYVRIGRVAVKSSVESQKLFRAATGLRKYGTGLGASLIAAGVYRGLQSTKVKKDRKLHVGVAVGSGVAAGFVLCTAFLRGMRHPVIEAMGMAAAKIMTKRFQ